MGTALTVLIWVIIGVIIIGLVTYLFIAYQINKTKKKAEKALLDGVKKLSDLNNPATQEFLKKFGENFNKNLENRK